MRTNALGLTLVFLSVLANALRTALSSKLLDGNHKMDVLAMQWTTSPVAAVALVPFAMAMEGTSVLAFLASNPWGGTAVLISGSVLALAYNLFLFHMIQVLKGVTANILGRGAGARGRGGGGGSRCVLFFMLHFHFVLHRGFTRLASTRLFSAT